VSSRGTRDRVDSSSTTRFRNLLQRAVRRQDRDSVAADGQSFTLATVLSGI
jgi:hypothetical protein